MGGGFSNALNMGHSSSSSTQNAAQVWTPQQQYLSDIYGDAQQQYNAQTAPNTNVTNNYNAAMGQMQQAGQSANASGEGLGGAQRYYGMSGNSLGMAQQNLSTMANPNGVDPMLGVYARQLGQQLNEQILPAMRGEAAVAGQLGSSRAGIGQGLATARVGQQLQDYSAQLYSDQQNRALSANQALQSGASLYQGIGQGLTQNALGFQTLANTYGQNAQQYSGLATQGGQLPWQNLQMYSALLGGPTVLDQGGQSASTSRNWGGSMAGSGQI